MKLFGITYTPQITDVLTLLIISDFVILTLLAKLRSMRKRIEVIERQLNIPPK